MQQKRKGGHQRVVIILVHQTMKDITVCTLDCNTHTNLDTLCGWCIIVHHLTECYYTNSLRIHYVVKGGSNYVYNDNTNDIHTQRNVFFCNTN